MTIIKERVYDEWLVLQCQSGNRGALDELLTRWQERLYAYTLNQIGNTEAAKDIVQESLISMTKGIGRLNEPAAFPNWAYQIVIRRSKDWLRKEARWRRNCEPLSNARAEPEPVPNENKDDIDLLRRGIKELGPDLGQLLHFFYKESFSIDEIASMIDIPRGTVKSRLYYARKKLKAYIEENGKGEY